MSVTASIRELKAMGLSSTATLVALVLNEEPAAPKGRIADALGVSVRTVEKALAELRPHAGRPVVTKVSSHDHDRDLNHEEGSATPSSRPAPDPADAELLAALAGLGVWPAVAADLLAERGREVVARHVAAHAKRLARGWRPDRCPAPAYLVRCIKQDRWPPAAPAPGRLEAERRAAEVAAAAPPPPAPTPSMSRATAIATARRYLRSSVPGMRHAAWQLAHEHGLTAEDLHVSPAELAAAAPPDTTPMEAHA